MSRDLCTSTRGAFYFFFDLVYACVCINKMFNASVRVYVCMYACTYECCVLCKTMSFLKVTTPIVIGEFKL